MGMFTGKGFEYEYPKIGTRLPSTSTPASAVATEAPGGAVPPLMDACAPPFRFIQNTVFGTSLNDKTPHNDGKRNNYVET